MIKHLNITIPGCEYDKSFYYRRYFRLHVSCIGNEDVKIDVKGVIFIDPNGQSCKEVIPWTGKQKYSQIRHNDSIITPPGIGFGFMGGYAP